MALRGRDGSGMAMTRSVAILPSRRRSGGTWVVHLTDSISQTQSKKSPGSAIWGIRKSNEYTVSCVASTRQHQAGPNLPSQATPTRAAEP